MNSGVQTAFLLYLFPVVPQSWFGGRCTLSVIVWKEECCKILYQYGVTMLYNFIYLFIFFFIYIFNQVKNICIYFTLILLRVSHGNWRMHRVIQLGSILVKFQSQLWHQLLRAFSSLENIQGRRMYRIWQHLLLFSQAQIQNQTWKL